MEKNESQIGGFWITDFLNLVPQPKILKHLLQKVQIGNHLK